MTPTAEKHLRQIQVPQIGLEGHEKIRQSDVLIVGAGGLGIPVAQYLAASGVRKIGIIDGDTVSESNLGRQITYSQKDIGEKKSLLLCQHLGEFHPEVQCIPYPVFLNEENAEELISSYSLIINASDNFQTRYLINKLCQKHNRTWINLAATQMEGQVCIFRPMQGCYHCLFPQTQNPISPGKNCASLGIMAPICGMIGSWGAQLALMHQMNLLKEQNIFYRYDGLKNQFQKYIWQKNAQCSHCGTTLPKSTTSSKVKPVIKKETKISLNTLSRWIEQKEQLLLIDIEPWLPMETLLQNNLLAASEKIVPLESLPPVLKIPMDDFFSKDWEDPPAWKYLSPQQKIVCLCPHGIKSKIVADLLQKDGYQGYYVIWNQPSKLS